MVIVDDHLSVTRLGGGLAALDPMGPIVTTYAFQFRLARAVADDAGSGQLSAASGRNRALLERILKPPAHRLVVLDPLVSLREAVEVAGRHRANLLLAQLVGAARHHGAGVRVTAGNLGRDWTRIMSDEGIDFGVIEA